MRVRDAHRIGTHRRRRARRRRRIRRRSQGCRCISITGGHSRECRQRIGEIRWSGRRIARRNHLSEVCVPLTAGYCRFLEKYT